MRGSRELKQERGSVKRPQEAPPRDPDDYHPSLPL